jgi:cleavage and polyadenylation specificity factor subunit 1
MCIWKSLLTRCEDPKSLSGQRLLHRSTFHAGHFPTSITLLPRTAVGAELAASTGDKMDTEVPVANHQILVTYQSGAVGLLTPLSESSYRRLSALQMQLWNALDHTCGLNPRAYRAAESDGIGGRTVVDGTLLRRWLELGNQRRKDVAGRAGAESWEIRADLEIVGGAGLGYL